MGKLREPLRALVETFIGLILQSHQNISIIISHVVYSRLSGNADSVGMFSSVQPRIGSGLAERELIE